MTAALAFVSAFERVIALLQDRSPITQWLRDGSAMAHCPGPTHRNGDRHPSLHVSPTECGCVIYCFTGCDVRDLISAIGLRMSDLFDGRTATISSPPTPVTTFEIALRMAERQPWRRPGVHDIYVIADHVRERYRAVDRARRIVTAHGSTALDDHDLLELASESARLESDTARVEAYVDELREGLL